ncbi:MAG: aminotransferase class IV [Bryobacterales bacterium]
MHPYLLYNDSIHKADEVLLRPGQLGLLAGWGVFTTLRIYEGVPFEFNRHWKRMLTDAAKINVPMPFERDQVRARLLELIERNQSYEATMRVVVVRSRNGVWEGPGVERDADLIAFSIPVKHFKDKVALDVREQGRHAASPFAGTKTLSWSHNLTMAENAANAGFDEVILLNERGEVAECTSANIFAVRDGVTLTPPLASGPLPGVTRAVMLDELDMADAPVREAVLTVDDLLLAEEVFITSSTRELIPVERIQDKMLAAKSWPVMEKLRAALQAHVRRYTAAQKQMV